LTRSHRLPPRGADFTGLFYDRTLRSVAAAAPTIPAVAQRHFHPEGGPRLVTRAIPRRDDPETCRFVMNIAAQLLDSGRWEVAIIAPYRQTVHALYAAGAASGLPMHRLTVDTIQRIQGMNCDFCIYLLPDLSPLTFQPETFNVATSRARLGTLIVGPENFGEHVDDTPLGVYAGRLLEDLSRAPKIAGQQENRNKQ